MSDDLIERLRAAWPRDALAGEAADALAAKDAEIAKLYAENVVLMGKNAGALDLAVSENARAEKAEADLAKIDAQLQEQHRVRKAWAARAEKAEIARLREALAHYATDENPDGWIAIAALTKQENQK